MLFPNRTINELRTVLEYPKFRLTRGEIKVIIEEEVLPFFEIVEITSEVSGVCKDPDDDKFISCALSASAEAACRRYNPSSPISA
jgi:predicted nucleic acid-binding protein